MFTKREREGGGDHRCKQLILWCNYVSHDARPSERPSTPLFDDIRIKETIQIRVRIFCTFQTHFKGLVCGYSKGTGTGLLRE